MTEEEYISRISSEILNGENIREEFKSLIPLRNDFGDGAAAFCAPMTPSYDQDTRMKIESELYMWETRVLSLIKAFCGNAQVECLDEFRISKPSLWSDFKKNGIRVVSHNIDVLKSHIECLPYLRECIKTMKKEFPYKVFISHSTEDANFAEALVALLESIGINDKSKIFCSSVPEYGIPPGEQIIDYLRKQFDENRLFVIFIHSKSYYKSQICLNEMGAAWALKTDFYSFLVKGFNYDEMDGVIDGSFVSTKVDAKEAKKHLNDLRDKLTDIFDLNKEESPRWEHYRDQFLEKVNSF